MGRGDRALGEKILGSFLRKVYGKLDLTAIVLYNSGVKLAQANSPVLADLVQLHDQGIELLPCGTCIEHYGIELAVGEASNMDEIIAELARADKVITL